MKSILTILIAISLQATEPIKTYDRSSGSDMKVWCFEGTKWLWVGSYNSPPIQIMKASDNHYKTVPKPVPCEVKKWG